MPHGSGGQNAYIVKSLWTQYLTSTIILLFLLVLLRNIVFPPVFINPIARVRSNGVIYTHTWEQNNSQWVCVCMVLWELYLKVSMVTMCIATQLLTVGMVTTYNMHCLQINVRTQTCLPVSTTDALQSHWAATAWTTVTTALDTTRCTVRVSDTCAAWITLP